MIRTWSVLFCIALVLLCTARLLGGTADKNAQRAVQTMLETLLPGETEFTEMTHTGADESIRSVYASAGGYVIGVVERGYVDDIRMQIGVKTDGTVVGLVVCEAHETPGLGSRILTDHAFLSRFLNRSGTFAIGDADSVGSTDNGNPAENTGAKTYVDGISGATVSSKAVARGVSAAVAYVTGTDAGTSATAWGNNR